MPFVVIQIIMVGLIIAFPGIVSRDLNKGAEGNIDQLQMEIDKARDDSKSKPEPQMPEAGGKDEKPADEDPMEAIRRANEQDKQKK